MRAFAIVVALGAAACSHPTSPTREQSAPTVPLTPAGQNSSTISGTVWLHTAEGVKPYADATLFGWVELGSAGRTTGPVRLDANGRYSFAASSGAKVRMHIAGFAYQPCAVTLSATGDVIRDFRVVSDPLQLGASLPAELLAETPRLSGTVFEVTADGRRPLKDVRVELDGLLGMGLVTATTLSDSDGRYVLCGLNGETSTYVYASKAGYTLADLGTVRLGGDTTLDIELRR
jgi:hypothetical protein